MRTQVTQRWATMNLIRTLIHRSMAKMAKQSPTSQWMGPRGWHFSSQWNRHDTQVSHRQPNGMQGVCHDIWQTVAVRASTRPTTAWSYPPPILAHILYDTRQLSANNSIDIMWAKGKHHMTDVGPLYICQLYTRSHGPRTQHHNSHPHTSFGSNTKNCTESYRKQRIGKYPLFWLQTLSSHILLSLFVDQFQISPNENFL